MNSEAEEVIDLLRGIACSLKRMRLQYEAAAEVNNHPPNHHRLPVKASN